MKIVLAHSPQAKGRVERVHGTHQDRLVKLLRLEGIGTMTAANAYLEDRYWKAYNGKFARPAAEAADLPRCFRARGDRAASACPARSCDSAPHAGGVGAGVVLEGASDGRKGLVRVF